MGQDGQALFAHLADIIEGAGVVFDGTTLLGTTTVKADGTIDVIVPALEHHQPVTLSIPPRPSLYA